MDCLDVNFFDNERNNELCARSINKGFDLTELSKKIKT